MWWKINREGDCTRNEEPLLAAKCKIERRGKLLSFTNKLWVTHITAKNVNASVSMFFTSNEWFYPISSQNPNKTIHDKNYWDTYLVIFVTHSLLYEMPSNSKGKNFV